MNQHVYINRVYQHPDQQVTLKGWAFNIRGSGKVLFIQFRDGTGFIQVVAGINDIGEEKFAQLKNLRIESSLSVTGLVKEDKRSKLGFEIQLREFEIHHIPELEYPIGKKEHGIDFLLSNRHLWLRSKGPFNVLKVRNEVLKAIRDFFYEKDFLLTDTPILTGSIGENAGELFATDYFDEGKAYLAQTGQLYLEAAAAAYGKVYCLGPTFRAEKSKTRRHLTEFWMLEAEVAYNDYEDNMNLQQEMILFILKRVLDKCRDNLQELGRDISKLEGCLNPFPRVDYDEAITILQKKGVEIKWGDDINAEKEAIFLEGHTTPVFIYGFPSEIKAFYMEPMPGRPEKCLSSDLLAPEGYGEIIGGSQRIMDNQLMIQKMKEQGLDPSSYEWYLDLRKFGGFLHSGFGLGVERTVSWICGLEHLREAALFPRMMYRIYP